MKEDWKKVLLADYYTISSGLSKSADQFGYGHPFVSFKDVFRNYFLPETLTQLVNTNDKERKSCSVKKGDVFLTRTSETIEELGMSSVALKDYDNATFNGFTKRLRPKNEGIDPRFIGFYLRSAYFRGEITAYSILTTRASLNNDIIGRLKINLPSLPTQQKIASILSAYDDLIENNNKRIQLLENMASEVYKEWFVRLRFPNYQNTTVIDGIPEGWEKVTLKDILELKMGQSPKSEYYNDEKEGLPFHQGVSNFNDRFPTHVIYCTDYKKIADKGDILLSVRAPVGRINIANDKLIIGRGLCAIKHKKGYQSYAYYLLKEIFKNEDSHGNGAVFKAVSRLDLERIKTLKPKENLVKQFQNMVYPMDKQIEALNKKNKLLQQTRDLLLPRLISGKLVV